MKGPKQFLFEDVQSYVLPEIVEAAKEKLPEGVIMRIRARVAHAGVITANERWYSRKLVGREVSCIAKPIIEHEIEGLAGHPLKSEGGVPDPARASYLITGITLDESGEVFMGADIYETTAGRDLAARIRAGAKVAFSTRGTGTSTRTTLTDEHEAARDNPTWVGREFEVVNDDYRLRSVDHVIGQAVEGAVLQAFQEHERTEEEEAMEFKIESLTDANWSLIEGSERVKKLVEAAVKAAQDKFEAEVVPMVKQYLESEAFIEDHFEVNEDGDDAGDSPADEAGRKCPECGAAVGAKAKFCPECGADLAADEAIPAKKGKGKKDETKDPDKDESETLKALRQRVEEMEAKERVRVANDQMEAIATDKLAKQPQLIAESVGRDISERNDLTPETIGEYVTGRIAHYEQVIKAAGVAQLPAGKAKVVAGDDDRTKNEGEPSEWDKVMDEACGNM